VKNLRRGDTSISEKKETFSIRQEERPVTRLAASMERKSAPQRLPPKAIRVPVKVPSSTQFKRDKAMLKQLSSRLQKD